MQQLFFDPFSHGNGNKKEKACKQLAHQTKETRKQHLHSPCSSFSQHPFVCVAVFPRASAAHNLHFFFFLQCGVTTVDVVYDSFPFCVSPFFPL
jgi:hypothetical protein